MSSVLVKYQVIIFKILMRIVDLRKRIIHLLSQNLSVWRSTTDEKATVSIIIPSMPKFTMKVTTLRNSSHSCFANQTTETPVSNDASPEKVSKSDTNTFHNFSEAIGALLYGAAPVLYTSFSISGSNASAA